MTVTEAVAADLQAKLSKAETRVKRLESTLAQARKERDELAVAIGVLVRHGYMDADAVTPMNVGRQSELNAVQSLVVACVPDSEFGAMAPKDVTALLHTAGRSDITADYVRTTLWRLAQRGILQNENGLYWRVDAPEAKSVAAPDADTSRAVNERVGPHGGGEVFPADTPEGSNPSGSTQRPSDAFFGDDPDDDIPF